MSKRLGLDLDGCLVSFDDNFHLLLEQISGRDLPHPGEPEFWDWPTQVCGCSKKEVSDAWAYIRSNPQWWLDLPVKDTEALDLIRLLAFDSNYSFYFITSRMPDQAKFYTELWLDKHRVPMPTVLLSSDKGYIARGLKLTAFCDDNEGNIADVLGASRDTRCYLVDRPFNRWVESVSSPVRRVSNLAEMLRTEIELTKGVTK